MPTKKTKKTTQESSDQFLYEGEQLFRSFVQQNIDGIILVDSDGVVVEWNASMEKLTGFRSKDMIGLRVWEMQLLVNREKNPTPERRAQLETAYKSIMYTGIVPEQTQSSETTIITTDGRKTFVEQKVFVIKASKGNWIGGIVRDLTERKKLELELEDERDFALQIINTVGQGLTVTDKNGNFVLVNPAFARLTGYEIDELIGRNPQEISTVDDEQTLKQALEDRGQGKTTTYSANLRMKDGGNVPVLITGTPRVKTGEYAGTIASITDMTDIKRTEAEREELIQILESQNAELERFNYTVSHDLKAPLVTIKGFLGYLEEDIRTGNVERLRKDTRRIANAVDKMNHLLGDLLELSRIGRMINPPEPVAFEDIVDDALKLLHGQLEAHRVLVQLEENLPIVFVDKPRLLEVLQNLVDNAAKFMGDQTDPRIEIGQHDEEDGKPVFFVKDNGIGIVPEYHERIFGLFNKLDAQGEGTGIGLALVKRIIEIHGGRIWIESEFEKGSTFYFTLPKPMEVKVNPD